VLVLPPAPTVVALVELLVAAPLDPEELLLPDAPPEPALGFTDALSSPPQFIAAIATSASEGTSQRRMFIEPPYA
jgi:hypothetical protein